MTTDFAPLHTGVTAGDDKGDVGHAAMLKINSAIASLRAAIDGILGVGWTTQNTGATATIGTKYLADSHSGFALTMPAAFTADTTADSDIWIANTDDTSNVTLTPASGDKFFLSTVDQTTDATIALAPGELAIIRPKTTNAEWDVFIMSAYAASNATPLIVAGTARVYRKTINYNDAGITTGIDVYTPAVGEVLLDAWFEFVTPWDTSCRADIGQFAGTNYGLYSATYNGPTYPDYGWGTSDDGRAPYISGGGGTPENSSLAMAAAAGTSNAGDITVPYVFLSTVALKVVVTDTGVKGGSDAGASAGQMRACVVIATPIDV